MIYLYIFALLIHGAFSITCQEGSEIASQETRNPEAILGKWTYVYHWDSRINYTNEFDDYVDHSNPEHCPEMQIAPVTPDDVKSKMSECASYKIPFNWNDAKLRLEAPTMNMTVGIIVIGEKDNWLLGDCTKFVRVVIRIVSDDYVVMLNPDVPGASEMISRKTPTLEELKCVAHNVDAVRGMKGVGLCYKN